MDRPDAAIRSERPHWLRIVRAYIGSFSMPLQGPISGSTIWITREQALDALAKLEAESNG